MAYDDGISIYEWECKIASQPYVAVSGNDLNEREPIQNKAKKVQKYCRHYYAHERAYRDRETRQLICGICGKPLPPAWQYSEE